mgnify:CR=1 FL=1
MDRESYTKPKLTSPFEEIKKIAAASNLYKKDSYLQLK